MSRLKVVLIGACGGVLLCLPAGMLIDREVLAVVTGVVGGGVLAFLTYGRWIHYQIVCITIGAFSIFLMEWGLGAATMGSLVVGAVVGLVLGFLPYLFRVFIFSGMMAIAAIGGAPYQAETRAVLDILYELRFLIVLLVACASVYLLQEFSEKADSGK